MPEDRVPHLTRRDVLTSAAAASALLTRSATAQAAAQTCYGDGMVLYRHYTAAALRQARACFLAALRHDPTCARAFAMLSATYRQDWVLGWATDRPATHARAAQAAQQGVALARHEPAPQPSLPFALQQWGFWLLYDRRHADARAAAEEAVALRPSYADGWALLGQTLAYEGHAHQALETLGRARALTEAPDAYHLYHCGLALVGRGLQQAAPAPALARLAYTDAERWLRAALVGNPAFRPARVYLVAVLWALGHTAEAHREVRTLHAMGRPPVTEALVPYLREVHPWADPALLERLLQLWLAAERWEGV